MPTFFRKTENPFTGVPMELVNWSLVYAALSPAEHPPSAWADGARRPGWKLLPSSEKSNTRIGGAPLLAVDQVWPTLNGVPLIFMAQLDFAELSSREGSLPAPFPQEGVLSFFAINPEPFEGTARSEYRLLYTTKPVVDRISDVPEWPLRYLRPEAGEFTPADSVVDDTERPHLVAGQPRWVQWGPSLEKIHLASGTMGSAAMHTLARAGIDPGKTTPDEAVRSLQRAGIHPKGVFAGSHDWMVIWQIPSTEATGFQFYDAGTIYVLMRPSDLAARAFERAWIHLECF